MLEGGVGSLFRCYLLCFLSIDKPMFPSFNVATLFDHTRLHQHLSNGLLPICLCEGSASMLPAVLAHIPHFQATPNGQLP